MCQSCFVHTDRPTHLSGKWVGDPPKTLAWATDPGRVTPPTSRFLARVDSPAMCLSCFVHTDRPTHLSDQIHTRAQLEGVGVTPEHTGTGDGSQSDTPPTGIPQQCACPASYTPTDLVGGGDGRDTPPTPVSSLGSGFPVNGSGWGVTPRRQRHGLRIPDVNPLSLPFSGCPTKPPACGGSGCFLSALT